MERALRPGIPQIFVCGLDDMPDHVAQLRPGRLISLLSADDQPPTPHRVQPTDHLRVAIDDIDEPQMGCRAPARSHIEMLVAFLRASPPQASILMHCLAGVSRSPAAALIALALPAPGRELQVAQCLRSAAPFVNPNRLMIQIADEVLGRRGKLVAALAAMGEPDWTQDFELFAVPRVLEAGIGQHLRKRQARG